MKIIVNFTWITVLLLCPYVLASWTEPVLVDTIGPSRGLPLIAERNDSIYVLYPDTSSFLGNNKFARSVDNGITWGNYYKLPDGFMPEYSDFKIAGDTMVIFYTFIQFPYTHHFIFSRNYGESWDSARHLTYPWLLSDGTFDYFGSTATFCGAYNFDGNNYYLGLQSSYDFGISWPDTETIFNYGSTGATPAFYYFFDRPYILVAGYQSMPGRSRMQLFVKFDSSWTISDVYDTSGDIPEQNMCASENGRMAFVFQDLDSWIWDRSHIFICTSPDSGRTWSTPADISMINFNYNPRVAISNDTLLVLFDASPDSTHHFSSVFLKRSYDLGQSWEPPEIVADSATAGDLHIDKGKIAVIYKKYIEGRYYLYYRRWEPEPDAIHEEHAVIPAQSSFYAYPNPFNSTTTITLGAFGDADIQIFDISGRLISSLITENGHKVWDASKFSSGLYFARIAGSRNAAIKLVLVK
jgi:hypothetical protein